ncbi:MAG: DUF6430 domain-containing protein [Candidatus Omnitrophica bacterium]|nr:DUF6430 domain-containing protein [Candidatus Omnitrophota bacterium]
MEKWWNLLIALVTDTLANILTIISFVFIAASFFKVECLNGQWKVLKTQNPDIIPFSIGIVWLVIALIIHIVEFKKIKLKGLLKKIDKGFRVVISGSQINIVFDNIRNVRFNEPQSAVVLPTNDSFDDECINDPRSSLGAFFQEYFPKGIKQIQNLIAKELEDVPYAKIDGINIYSLNMVVYLDGPLGSSQKVILVSITKKRKMEGIKSDPTYIANGILEVFKFSSDKKIAKLYMPVLGAGHGGVDFNVALHTLLLEIAYNLTRKNFHHVKELNIIIYDPDKKLEKEVKKIIYCVLETLN